MDYLDQTFGPDGLFAQAFPGYEPRPGQVQLAQAIDHAIQTSSHLVAEGPCGIGKSFAYLVPAIYHSMQGRPAQEPEQDAQEDDGQDGLPEAAGRLEDPDRGRGRRDGERAPRRVVVATANIALQEQLVKQDLPTLSRVLPWPFRFALLKGRSNYLCQRKLRLEQPSARDPQIAAQLDELAAWAQETATGDVSELPFVPDPRAWSAYSSGADECHGGHCKDRMTCWANRARRAAHQADVVVTNYHQLFAHVQLRMATGRDQLLPAHRLLVCDEAHELAGIARSFFGWTVSEWTVRRLARWAIDRADHRRLGEQVRRLGHDFFDQLSAFARGPNYRRRLREPGVAPSSEELVRALQDVGALADVIAESDRADEDEKGAAVAISRQAGQAAERLLSADELDDPGLVYYLDVNGQGRASVAAQLLDPGPVLERELFGRLDSAVLCSATMTTTYCGQRQRDALKISPATMTCNGSFEFLRQQVGAPESTLEVAVDTPFDFGRQAILVVPPMPDPRDPAWPHAAGEVARAVVAQCDGRSLFLCTSYRVLGLLRDELRGDQAHRVMAQGDLPRTELARIFREDEKSVLLGCESFWTGIDVPGPALTAVVIDKLPFPHLDDPIVDAQAERNPRSFQEFMVPTAILMFRQGVGRLIRRGDDVGVVVVLDCRLRTKGYGSRFLDSLPGMYQTANVEEIGQFLAWSGRPSAGEVLGEQSELWGRVPLDPAGLTVPFLGDDEIPF